MDSKETAKTRSAAELKIEDFFANFGLENNPTSDNDVISLDIGYHLIPLVDNELDGTLFEKIQSVRKQISVELGFTCPPVHIQDDMLLDPREYKIRIKDFEVGNCQLLEDHCLATASDAVEEKIDGITVKDPIYGMKAIWIRETNIDEAKYKGYRILDFSTIILTHLYEIVKQHAHEIVNEHEVNQMLNILKEFCPEIVEKLSSDLVPFTVVPLVKKLLKEKVPLNDMATILEGLAEQALVINDLDQLFEYFRQLLAKHIANTHQTKIA